MEGNRKSVRIHCSKTGIHVEGANNIGSTSDTIESCKRSFLRVCSGWWNTYCGRDEEDEPLRNCDVGSAMEQGERFSAYCRAHKHPESECLNCPLLFQTGGHCELAWAQLPYVEKEAAIKENS